MKQIPKHLKIAGLLLILVILFTSVIKPTYTSSVNLYNTTSAFKVNYNRQEQKQISNYDGYYLAFEDKKSNANLGKEAFIEVTKIVMENRKDGQNLSWKWLQENQPIPYEQFMVFYQELSSFISSRYADNMAIEQEKQRLVEEHNISLIVYPNNMINKVLGIKPMKYKAGFISDYTKAKFK